MAQIGIVLITLLIGLCLFLGGLYFKKKAMFLALAGSILILITGIILLVDEPITFKSGQTIDINNSLIDNVSTTTETFTYSPQNSTLNNILSWTIILLGLAGVIGTSLRSWNMRYDEEE